VKRDNVQKNFIQKLKTLKTKLDKAFPEIDGRLLTKYMCELGHYHYNKKNSFLLGEQKKLYEWLIENGYNPFTVYRWCLLDRIPEDIRFMLREKKISQKKAIFKAFKRKHETESDLTESIREIGLKLVRAM